MFPVVPPMILSGVLPGSSPGVPSEVSAVAPTVIPLGTPPMIPPRILHKLHLAFLQTLFSWFFFFSEDPLIITPGIQYIIPAEISTYTPPGNPPGIPSGALPANFLRNPLSLSPDVPFKVFPGVSS